MKRFYKIAGLTVEMDTFGKTEEQARPYLLSDECAADVRTERYTADFRERYPSVSDEDLEYMYSGMSFYKQLIDYDGIMLHSSAVVVDGRAYLFTANPGTGKSTHTELYLKEFGDRAFILNDDKPAIRLEGGIFYAYGTPWSGKSDKSANVRAPLAGVCILCRGEINEIERVGAREAIIGIYAQTLRPQSRRYADKVLTLVERLIERVPVWRLSCNMEQEAARVSYDAMSEA